MEPKLVIFIASKMSCSLVTETERNCYLVICQLLVDRKQTELECQRVIRGCSSYVEAGDEVVKLHRRR